VIVRFRPKNWPTSAEEALRVQDELRPRLDLTDPGPAAPTYVAGLDVAYGSTGELAAAAVVLEAGSLDVLDQAVVVGEASFPYIPGLFAFRELPGLLAALDRLSVTPELLVCDGQGLAHPRRFGLACHLGVLTDLPTMGVAKTCLVGVWEPPDTPRGSWSPLIDQGKTVGRVLRTREGVKPVFVSVGHRMSLDNVCAQALRLTRGYRLPEVIRAADHAGREALVGRPT
jgi:deoxyribonuclease V